MVLKILQLVILLCLIDVIMSFMRVYEAHSSSGPNARLNVSPMVVSRSRSPLRCMISCLKSPGCQTFNFRSDKHCELLNAHLCDGTAYLVADVGYRYFDVDRDRGDKQRHNWHRTRDCTERHRCLECGSKGRTLGGSCVKDADCHHVTGTTCRYKSCECKPEFHQSLTLDACLRDCSTFGTNFTVVRGYALKHSSETTELSSSTLNSCKKFCTSAKDVCRSVSFSPSTGTCILSSASCSPTHNAVCRNNALFDYYSRHCI